MEQEVQDYTLLVIDDEAPMLLMLDKILEEEYHVISANTAQEGIDILSREPVHFILTDIHMPGMSGLEFLEALIEDADRKNIPVLIMTSLPSVEKEQKALGLGAVDFIDKALFNTDIDELLNRIRMKLVANVEIPDLPEELELNRKELTKKLLFDISSGDFLTAIQKLCKVLGKKLHADHLSFWTIQGEHVQMLLANGIQPPQKYGPEELKNEKVFQHMLDQKRPYFSNNVYTSDTGILAGLSKEEGLPAEIGVPLFALTEKELIEKRMRIPPDIPIFGYIVLKRKRVFTSKEFKLISTLLVHTGTTLWRFYNDL